MNASPELHNWAIALAEEVVPHERSTAPDVVDAFIAGGSRRKDLFSTAGVAGGISAEPLISVFPSILLGVTAAGTFLSAVLRSDQLREFLGCLKSSLDIALVREKSAGLQGSPHSKHLAIQKETGASVELKQVSAILFRELKKAGLPALTAEAISYRVLMKLLKAPASAESFVAELQRSSPPTMGTTLRRIFAGPIALFRGRG